MNENEGKIFCPACGGANNRVNTFCMYCGERIYGESHPREEETAATTAVPDLPPPIPAAVPPVPAIPNVTAEAEVINPYTAGGEAANPYAAHDPYAAVPPPAASPQAAGVPPQPSRGLAIASLVCGVISIFCCGCVTGPGALVMGLIAKKNPAGKGLAVAGIVTGAIGMLLWIGLMVLYIAMINQFISWQGVPDLSNSIYNF